MCGDLCGGSYGDVWGGCLADTGPVRQAMKCWFTWQGYVFIRQLGGRPPSRKRQVDQPLREVGLAASWKVSLEFGLHNKEMTLRALFLRG